MDDQDLAPFQPVQYSEWLKPIPSVYGAAYNKMIDKIVSQEWKLWDLHDGHGVVVTYPWEGTLFIYYLRGRRLFDKLRSEDLLRTAREEGLQGLKTETASPAMLRMLQHIGFEIYAHGPHGWCLELNNGRL